MCSYLSSNAAVNATRKQVSKTGDPTSYVPSGRPNVVSQGIVPEISRERFKYVCVLRAFQHAGESTATDIYIYLYIYILCEQTKRQLGGICNSPQLGRDQTCFSVRVRSWCRELSLALLEAQGSHFAFDCTWCIGYVSFICMDVVMS